MLFVLGLMAVIWGIGAVMKAPVRGRLAMIGALYALVVLTQLVLPDGAALREGTGGSPAPWLMLGATVALVLGYRAGLRRLRARAAPEPPA
ncbi:molybdopterin biosynthesis protein, partial [Rhodobaculum claviforme]|nr:molybdopterin biosynthesis protein [Rhodobaculum claviforme]